MALRQHLLVRVISGNRRLASLHIRGLAIYAMIDKSPHRNHPHQLRQPAHVVGMVVRHHQVVDLRHPRQLAHRPNPPRVSGRRRASGIWRSRVHQQALARGHHKQRRLPALHIHKVNLQFLVAALRRSSLRRTALRPRRSTHRKQHRQPRTPQFSYAHSRLASTKIAAQQPALASSHKPPSFFFLHPAMAVVYFRDCTPSNLCAGNHPS